ncbi:unknown protein [Spodoptera frugiperda multiple nucleopolyhedrovirus]|uniref:Sf32 n=2 Tax=Spodoptera frugiperda nuclear polyhedrosis virus TaxID=10455 RepID=A1YJ22_NPVSF|nr:hypothetical protein SFMNPV_gp032 [Spodoptera frugiperda multiple nucleopolyhedrovirus]ABM45742.1 unknown protein [Spodoptera frugiperda multiple nucleopolyhedrovirus]ADV91263.1 hypothetical protein Sf32 [Spodoptera frugiperda multiple nucleopolyhedrovirus]AFH58971.1 hypothetical protein Sf32 [Spodoptera frugiperda multiple nucleopolyhedrovirus]AIW01443.1 hypothetical protein [Spodoptera frugiperda multiple nucleopolyhedrovirus]QED39945.1 hypothetical protein [Spodoptera frugiperda multiple
MTTTPATKRMYCRVFLKANYLFDINDNVNIIRKLRKVQFFLYLGIVNRKGAMMVCEHFENVTRVFNKIEIFEEGEILQVDADKTLLIEKTFECMYNDKFNKIFVLTALPNFDTRIVVDYPKIIKEHTKDKISRFFMDNNKLKNIEDYIDDTDGYDNFSDSDSVDSGIHTNWF